MSSSIVITIGVIGAVAWLAFLGVAALRSRGKEEIPPNLAPGMTDDVLETNRLERAQVGAVLLSAFLAVGLPLYYLTESNRQESFVDQFHEESVERGEHLVEEFACYGCHGPGGAGGVAPYVEKRSGVSVSWAAPPLNDIFYRYGREEVRYWIAYGRGNSPMPPWGVVGGGPMNDQQIEDIINYLETQQIPQIDAVQNVDDIVTSELQRLEGAEAAVAAAVLRQRQVIADLERAPELAPIAQDLAIRARAALTTASQGLDTDGDGLSDAAETLINDITQEAKAAFLLPGLVELSLDPANPATNGSPDREAAEAALAGLRGLVASSRAPALEPFAEAIAESLENSGPDGDGDGVADEEEPRIGAQMTAAIGEILPSLLRVTALDPTNTSSQGGESDLETASQAVSGLESIALGLQISTDNFDKLIGPARDSLSRLQAAGAAKAWEFDFESIAARTFGGDVESAQRVVGIFNGYCARCHTAGYSAGVPYQLEAGSGGFAPALRQGRPAVQFLDQESLVAFLTLGAEANKPYGVNGFGNGQMPGFGKQLSVEDLELLARWLLSGDLTGKG